jgi:hypothetical protein
MKIWVYNPITGYWQFGRDATPDTAQQWLAIWQQDRPAGHVVVAKRRPNKKPGV